MTAPFSSSMGKRSSGTTGCSGSSTSAAGSASKRGNIRSGSPISRKQATAAWIFSARARAWNSGPSFRLGCSGSRLSASGAAAGGRAPDRAAESLDALVHRLPQILHRPDQGKLGPGAVQVLARPVNTKIDVPFQEIGEKAQADGEGDEPPGKD